MAGPGASAWVLAALALGMGGLLILVAPGVALLGLLLALIGGLLLLGQAFHAPATDGPTRPVSVARRHRWVVPAVLASMLLVVGVFAYGAANSPTAACGAASIMTLGPVSFPSSSVRNTSLAAVEVVSAPCPGPTTSDLRVALDLSALHNTSAACGPGSGLGTACPASTNGWYVVLVDGSGQVMDSYPNQALGDAWVDGGPSVSTGDSFEVVTATPLGPTSATLGFQIDWNGCDVPWCGTAQATV